MAFFPLLLSHSFAFRSFFSFFHSHSFFFLLPREKTSVKLFCSSKEQRKSLDSSLSLSLNHSFFFYFSFFLPFSYLSATFFILFFSWREKRRGRKGSLSRSYLARPRISQFRGLKIHRTTFLDCIELGSLYILRLHNRKLLRQVLLLLLYAKVEARGEDKM